MRRVLFLSLPMSTGALAESETIDRSGLWDVNGPLGPSGTAKFATDEGTWMSLDVHPDGDKTIFDRLGDLYVMSIDGGKATRLTNGGGGGDFPKNLGMVLDGHSGIEHAMSPSHVYNDVSSLFALTRAEYLGMDKDLGSISQGKLADLIVLDKNPLEEIENTDSVNMTVINGVVYDADSMDQVWPQKVPRGRFFFEQ
jgi:hypothetical protein